MKNSISMLSYQRCLSLFLTLVPKKKNPQGLGDFRPISLLGCIYKILAKVLATRLRNVLGTIIAHTQTAFLPGRYILDGVLVINEVVELATKSGKDCLIFKVDFEKAYDSINWSFLDYMMMRVGMDSKWRTWIKECAFKGDMSILINGSPTNEISIQKRLKQGDPLALFLFLLVVEGLARMMRNAVTLGLFKGFKITEGERRFPFCNMRMTRFWWEKRLGKTFGS